MMSEAKSTVANLSVKKTFAIIEAMAKNQGAMRLLDISKECQTPSATVLRMLTSLMDLGYVVQYEDNRYALSLKFAYLGERVSAHSDLHTIARPFLRALSQRCAESSCLAIEQDMGVVYIDVVNAPDNVLRASQYIGKSAPMHCTGVGKLMLTAYSREQLTSYIVQKGLPTFTPHTISSQEALEAELAAAAKNGYAMDNEECEMGLRCIAAPVYNYTGKIAACISISGPVSRMDEKKIQETIPIILKTAQDLSKQLGYTFDPSGSKS